MSRTLNFILYIAVLAVALMGCESKVEISPAEISPVPATALPSAIETLVPSVTSVSLPTSEPTAVPQPTSPPEVPAPPPATDTPLPAPSPTPAGPLIAPIQPGQAVTITMIHMLDSTSGWAIGGLGQGSDHVLTTADGGQTWRDVTPPEPEQAGGSLLALGSFMDAGTAWVTFHNQNEMTIPITAVVWRTQDGGQSWVSGSPLELQGLNELYWPSDLVFVDSQNGWLLVHVGAGMSHDYVALFRTQDGGQTWARLIDPYGDSGIQGCQKTGLVFTSAQNGWLTGDCVGVIAGAFLFQSADGGQTWQSVALPAPAEAPELFADSGPACGTQSPVFFSPQVGKLIVRCVAYTQDSTVTSFYLYATRDGGETWVSAPSPAGTLAFLTEENGWALDRDLFHTTDGGQSWNKVKTVNWDGQFSFVSDTLGWAVARAAADAGTLIALVQTSDGGQTWTEIHPVTAP
jgi:photosystem II stability/assembly factor-like uncharacterized protein